MSLAKISIVTIVQAHSARPAQPESHDCPPALPIIPNSPPLNSGGVHGCVMVPTYVPVGNNYGKTIAYVVIGSHQVCY